MFDEGLWCFKLVFLLEEFDWYWYLNECFCICLGIFVIVFDVILGICNFGICLSFLGEYFFFNYIWFVKN